MREAIGTVAGWLSAPLVGLIGLARRGRVFHPTGDLYEAEVIPLTFAAERFAGRAVVRLSSALWKRHEWTDALGLAMRIKDEQDLLFATIKSPLTLFTAPLKTEVHDYLANDYFGVAPFDALGMGRVKLRMRSARPAGLGEDRSDRLEQAVLRGAAIFQLEMRKTFTRKWIPIAEVRLTKRIEEEIRFDPFKTGLGLEPRGFVHALRRGIYAVRV
jgi:hypothetical protein